MENKCVRSTYGIGKCMRALIGVPPRARVDGVSLWGSWQHCDIQFDDAVRGPLTARIFRHQ